MNAKEKVEKPLTIKQIKKLMTDFRDIYGSDFIDSSRIPSCKTKRQLLEVIDGHIDHIEMAANDAIRHVERFKQKINLNIYSL